MRIIHRSRSIGIDRPVLACIQAVRHGVQVRPIHESTTPSIVMSTDHAMKEKALARLEAPYTKMRRYRAERAHAIPADVVTMRRCFQPRSHCAKGWRRPRRSTAHSCDLRIGVGKRPSVGWPTHLPDVVSCGGNTHQDVLLGLQERGRPSMRRGAYGGTKGTAPARFAEDTEPGEVHGYRNNGMPPIR